MTRSTGIPIKVDIVCMFIFTVPVIYERLLDLGFYYSGPASPHWPEGLIPVRYRGHIDISKHRLEGSLELRCC